MAGCIQRGSQDGVQSGVQSGLQDEVQNGFQNGVQSGRSQDKSLSNPSSETTPVRLEIDYDSEVSSRFFKARGCLVLWGNRSLPYLVLNATLLKSGRPVSSTKYMMIEIEPNRENSFDISKNMRIPPGSYSCILEALGPFGQMASEARECRTMEPFFAEPPVPEPKPRPSLSKPSASKPSSVKTSPVREEEQSATSGRPENSVESPEWTKADDKTNSEKFLEEQEIDILEPGANASHDGSLVGSASSNKYHLPSCRYATKIQPENRIHFANEEEAKRKGYISCKTCNP